MPNASVPTFRPATPRDEAFRLRLYATTRADELAMTNWTERQRAEFVRSQFVARERSYHAAFPVATHEIICLGSVPIGAVILSRSADEIRVVDLALLPAYQGRGVGTAWLQERQAEARLSQKPLRLHVLKQSPALRLYLRLGFAPTGENGLYQKLEWRADADASA